MEATRQANNIAAMADSERQKFLEKHGNAPLKFKHISWFADSMGGVLKEQVAPLRRRIEALEAEVKAGHERIRNLEARNE